MLGEFGIRFYDKKFEAWNLYTGKCSTSGPSFESQVYICSRYVKSFVFFFFFLKYQASLLVPLNAHQCMIDSLTVATLIRHLLVGAFLKLFPQLSKGILQSSGSGIINSYSICALFPVAAGRKRRVRTSLHLFFVHKFRFINSSGTAISLFATN